MAATISTVFVQFVKEYIEETKINNIYINLTFYLDVENCITAITRNCHEGIKRKFKNPQ